MDLGLRQEQEWVEHFRQWAGKAQIPKSEIVVRTFSSATYYLIGDLKK